MSAVRLVLEEQDALSVPGEAPAVSRARRGAALVAALLTLGAGVAAGLWLARRAESPRIVRATIPADMFVTGTDRSFAFTPDGARLVYIGRDTNQILVRRLDALDATPILTTATYLRGAFPSPDGQWLAFIENSFTLRKVAIAGGPAATIVQMDGPSRGASWGSDGTIVFATGATDTGIQQVAASGGAVTVLTRPNREGGEADHLHPVWLPGGRAVLFTIRPARGGINESRIAVLDLNTRTWRTVLEGGYGARYVQSGHLVYAATGALWAIRFDLSQLKTDGAPVEVLRPVPVGSIGAVAHFDVASDGTLAYPRDARSDADAHVPVWVDRQHRETPIDAPVGNYRHPRLSPDGRRLAVVADGDIVIWDIERPWAAASRMTFDAATDWFPVWTPDGKRIIFGSWRGGRFSNLFIQEPGRADATRLTDSPDMQLPTSITPDGSTLVFHSFTQRLEALRLNANGNARQFALVETPQEERNGVVSPDGRWLAYEGESSTRAGQLDIYVRPFPDVQRSLWQMTTEGGFYPAWSTKGRELFYLKPDGTLVVIPVENAGNTWRAGTPVDLFRGPYLFQGDGSLGRQYDAAPDGQRFILLKNVRDAAAPHFVIVQHWLEELKRQVPRD
jgi:serine/threonine-protein kinase